MTKYMPSSWVPRLFEDDLYDAELTVWTVCLPRSVRCELLQNFERCERGMSLAGNISGVYWRNWTTTRNPDGTHAGDIVYGSYYDDHAQAVASQRQLCALMLEYWRREQ